MSNDIIDVDPIDPTPINVTDDSAIIVRNFGELVQRVITEAQFSILSGKTPKSVIKHRPGKGGKTFAYIPHGYVVAVLNRAFGLDWSFEIMPYGGGDYFKHLPGVKGTTSDGKPLNHPGSILVHGRLTVRVRDPQDPTRVVAEISKTATGEKEETNGMTWGSMVKAAESDALKKCATRLGVGGDLYWSDSEQDLVESDPRLARVRSLQSEGKSASEIADLTGISKADVRNLME